jgi:CheY-like chemotaxis protein
MPGVQSEEGYQMTSARPLRILVVDDKPNDFDVAKHKVLESGAADLQRVPEPYSFAQIARTASLWADVIILDLGLNQWAEQGNKMTAGERILKWLRGRSSPPSKVDESDAAKLRIIPIIIFTSQSDEVLAKLQMSVGLWDESDFYEVRRKKDIRLHELAAELVRRFKPISA